MRAEYFLLLSAALHVVGSVLTGFQGIGLFLLFPAVLYTAFSVALHKGVRWVAWVALVCMIGGMAGTAWELIRASIIPDWVLWGIIAADLGAAVLLVRIVWRHVQSLRASSTP